MKTYKLGLIGEKLGHSFSPAIHARLGTPEYALFELKPEELGPFLEKGDFDGLNVTIPYKKAVIPYCAELTEQARRIGSVNTIVRRTDGTLLGHNTDYDGFLYMLRSSGAEIKGKKCLVLGTGGASLTVHTVLQDLQAGEIVSISRTGENNYQNLERHADAQIIVNSTPVGMWPNTGKAPLDVARFPKLEGVFDLVYNPARTQILLDAERQGALAVNGLGMLVAQAKAASERFRGIRISDDVVEQITDHMERQSKNILLVGMPGCGKSTIGRRLAKALNRPLVDTDEEIVKRIGCSIPEYFARYGEEEFRRREHEVLREFSGRSGQIIATGGGIVTRPENTDPLRENSVVVFLRRDIDRLPTKGRPISQSSDLRQLNAKRRPLYEAVADLTVDNVNMGRTVNEILEKLGFPRE